MKNVKISIPNLALTFMNPKNKHGVFMLTKKKEILYEYW